MKRKIARFNKRITIQKNTIVTDKYKNHTNAWVDYYKCSTYASTYEHDKEEQGEATIKREQTINFEVRYCSEVQGLTSDKYRVIFNGDIYDIVAVDMMNYQAETIIIQCKFQEASK